MGLLSEHRIWWQKPKKYANQEAERKVSFLELFYDLVYVVMIAQVSHLLAVGVTATSFWEFMFLFVSLFYAWLNGALYHDLHGNDDIKTRIITFVQMFLVVGMAVFVHNAFSSGSVGFSIFFGLYLLTITILWYRSGHHDHDHRVLSVPYSIAYLSASLLFLVAPLFAMHWRIWLWSLALFITVLSPVLMLLFARHNPKAREQQERATMLSPSIVERFGLMTIIVLGEVIVGVVNGVISHHHLDISIAFTAFLSMSIAVALWWIYFDFISERKLKQKWGAIWALLHIPLALSITAIGASVVNIIGSDGVLDNNVKYLLLGSVATFLIIIILMSKTIDIAQNLRKIYQTSVSLMLVAIVSVIALIFMKINTITLIFCIDLVLLLPIYYGVRVWIKQQKKLHSNQK